MTQDTWLTEEMDSAERDVPSLASVAAREGYIDDRGGVVEALGLGPVTVVPN